VVALTVTLKFGLPPFVDWLSDTTRAEHASDTRWHLAGTISSSLNDWATPVELAFANNTWIIAGSVGYDPQPAILTPPNGRTWTSATVQIDPQGDTNEAQIDSVVYAHGRWIGGQAKAFGHLNAAVWQSGDGKQWLRVNPGDPALGGTGAAVHHASRCRRRAGRRSRWQTSRRPPCKPGRAS
jgi:hypothetical protein